MSRTKVVATFGPACQDEKIFRAMLRSGLDVVRLNISHLDPDRIAETVRRIRGYAARERMPLAVLADMPGPKIRCTECEPPKFDLHQGQLIDVSAGSEKSTPSRIAIPYPYLLEDVRAGHQLAINDGLVLLQVDRVDKSRGVLRCAVLRGGPVSSRKGVSFPQSSLRIKGLTPRDRKGMIAATASGVDFIALSFVRSGSDIEAAHRILLKTDRPGIPLVSKIEQREALENFDSILAASDGIMVARGDMGIEHPLERVPLIQKDIIRQCNAAGKFVITATQMLESMTENALPTRAEVSDVANAILDGTDAVMLSAETASGQNPVAAVEAMTRIALTAESRIEPEGWLSLYHPANDGVDLDDALAHAACQLSIDAKLDALVCISFYGTTAKRLSRYRPPCPIYVLSPYEEYFRRLAITWGVEVFSFPDAEKKGKLSTQTPGILIASAIRTLLRHKRLKPGDRIAMLAGVPLGIPGSTNWMRIVEI